MEGSYTLEKAREQMKVWKIPDWQQENIEPLGEGKHIFSHVEWHMTGYHIRLKEIVKDADWTENDENWALVSRKEMEEQYALPSAFDCFKKRL